MKIKKKKQNKYMYLLCWQKFIEKVILSHIQVVQ